MNTKIKLSAKLSILSIITLLGFLGGLFIPINNASAAYAVPSCNSAVLNGNIVVNGATTTVWFEWGPNSSIVYSTPHQTFSSDSNFSQSITGLNENSLYSYRAMASNENGTSTGQTLSFTTSTCTPAPTTLTCRLDSATTPAPNYVNKGVKFEAFGGNGTYTWQLNGGYNSTGTTGQQVWPSWSTAGYKTVTVTSGSQTCTNSVNIIDNAPATCQEPNATNYRGALPCTYYQPPQTCQTPSAINYGGALPCKYQQNPTVNISANPSSVQYNGTSTLTWNSTNATSCSASGGTNGWSGSKTTSGSFYTGALTNTTTYNITCTSSTGQQANDSVTVSVDGQVQNPTVNISANPSSVQYNGTSTLTWNSTNATSCSASGGTNGWSGSKTTSGSFYTGALTNTTTYNITCTSSTGQQANDSVTVNVNNSNNNNVNVNITADDTNIDSGDSTRIRWDSDNADYCTASGGSNGWSGNKNTSGSFNTGSLTSDKTYRITCYNNNDSADDSVTVNVNDNNNNNDENPDVTTRSATNISTNSATLNGRVDGNGSSVRAWFEYGTNTSLGYTTAQNSYGSGSTDYSRSVSGLIPNTTYYFRAVAENSQDTVYGNILSFNTTGNTVVINNQPTVVIYSDQTNLGFNSATTVRWSTTNATSCFASGGSIGWAGAKSTGPGSFYTGSLTGTRTYTITCSNNVGSSTDSVTVNVRGQTITTNNPRPAPTSLVLITSSVDRNQPIVPTLDNTRPHPGDEINYTVSYQNIGTAAITGLTLRIDLPYEVDYMFSNPSNPIRSGNTLIFNLGTLKANGQGTVTVRVRVRENIPAGTNLNFPAILSYIDPSGFPQSVTANVSAQIWSEPVPVNENVQLGANVFGAGFLPTNLFGWLLLVILILILVLLAKYLFGQPGQPFSKRTTTTLDQPLGKKTTTTTIQ